MSKSFIVIFFICLSFAAASQVIIGQGDEPTIVLNEEQKWYDNRLSGYLYLLEEQMSFNINIEELYKYQNIKLAYEELASQFVQKGIEYFENSEYQNAELLFYGGLYIYVRLFDLKNSAFVLNFLGTTINNQGKYESSMQKYLQALRFYEAIGDFNGISNVYNNIGVLYKSTGDMVNALRYARLTLNVKKKMGNIEGIAASVVNIGNIFSSTGDFDSSLYYHFKSLDLYTETGNKTGIAVAYNNIASLYIDMEQYDEAYDYAMKAYVLNRKQSNKYSMMLNVMNIATILERKGKYADARDWAEQGLILSEEMGTSGMNIPIFRLMVKIYSAVGDYEKAFQYQTKYISLNDSLWDVETKSRFEELEMQYQSQKKETQIESQNLQIVQQNLTLSRRNSQIFITLGFTLFIIAAFGFVLGKMKMRQQKRLNQMIVDEERKKTKEIIDAVEEERRRIARDLHDGIGQNLAALKLKLVHLSEQFSDKQVMSGEAFAGAIESLDETYREARQLSHQMMPKTLLISGLVNAISDLLAKTFDDTGCICHFDHNVSARFDQYIEISLFRICQELVSNIIRHSGADRVEVSLLTTAGQVILIVEDNGKGISRIPLKKKE
jgi:signal transduction histidine kinase